VNDAALRDANALLRQGRRREALACYETYLDGNPQSAEAWHNCGIALAQMKRYADAIPRFDKALGLRPDAAQAWNNRAHALFELKRFAEAAVDYERALALDPAYPFARGYRLLAKLWCCDWTGLEAEKAKIRDEIRAGRPVMQPFGNLMVSETPEDQLRCARTWTRLSQPEAPPPLWRGERYGHEKIRVAYVSGDFAMHPVALLMAGVFEHHDRCAFETIAVSYGGDDGSALRARLERAFDHFIDGRGLSDFAIASRLREMEVDIAVDLMGLTGECRNGILAHRPAPVQVNYLGYPGTMGVGHMDYILADRIVIPDDERQHYAEQVVHLPDTYMATDRARAIAPEVTRAEAGLPPDGVVFCSFNRAFKYTPATFDVWMRVLAAVEGSVLWLPRNNESAQSHLRREAAARGIASERLVFAARVEKDEDHLARLACADLFLDTLPHNAHSTAVDALWAGVPVLTAAGSSFAGRVAASLLHALGLPELATPSLADYEALAIRLGREPQNLAALKATLAEHRLSAPLFDTARFTRALESAFCTMRAHVRNGEPPKSFAVEAAP
jgi:predicted O-linked N-acetylglucosamine transferase (SPINDLY family)